MGEFHPRIEILKLDGIFGITIQIAKDVLKDIKYVNFPESKYKMNFFKSKKKYVQSIINLLATKYSKLAALVPMVTNF